MSLFTYKEQQFLKENVKGKTVIELTNLFNIAFNKNVEVNTIRNFKKKHKLKSGINTKFVKNQQAHNYKPVGSEFVTKDGYTMIKTKDPNTWKLKHRYIYECMYGNIPTGYSVIFADQDKTNFNIENLILVESKDKLVAKNKHLLFENKELTETGLLIAKLINKASNKKRRNNNESI